MTRSKKRKLARLKERYKEMFVCCKRCGVMFKSLIIDQTMAIADISKQLSEHWGRKHVAEGQQIGQAVKKITMNLAFYFTSEQMMLVPEDDANNFLRNEIEKAEEMILAVMGVDSNDIEPDLGEDKGTDSGPATPDPVPILIAPPEAETAPPEANKP